MGRTTLAVTLKPEAGRDGLHVVRIRITKDRTAKFWALNVSVSEKHFNVNGTKQLTNWVRRSCYDHGAYNERVLTAVLRAEKAVEFFDKRDLPYSSADVRDYLEQGGYPDRLLPYFAAHIADRRKAAGGDLGKLTTANGYESTLKVLRHYLRETTGVAETVTDADLDARYWPLGKFSKKDVLSLKEWLEAAYAPNSVTSYLRNLRHVLYLAAEAGLVSYERFPMRGVSFGVQRKKVSRLQESEIEHLATAPDIKKNRGGHPAVTDPIHARPLAMAMYLVHGARLGDALTWRAGMYVIEGTEHRLRYITGKSDKPMSVLLDDEARALLEPYRYRPDGSLKRSGDFLFPYLPDGFDKLPTDEQFLELRRAKTRARQQVIRLGERIGLTKHLTPHVMRHSFADMMRRAGVPLETRQEALAHSDIKTTRNYEEQFDQDAVDAVSMLYQRNRRPKPDNSRTTEEKTADNETISIESA